MAVYTRPHKRKLIKRSRTRPVYGEGDDEGKYFRCWNCGFICDVDRDELGDSESNAGDEHTDYHETHHVNTYDPPVGVLGPDIVTNGTFDSDTGWTKSDAAVTISSGKVNWSGAQAGYAEVYQEPSAALVVGKTYECVFTVSSYSAGYVKVYVAEGNTGTAASGTFKSANGTYTDYLRPLDISTYTQFRIQGDLDFIGKIDNVSLKEVLYLPGNESRYAVLGGDTGHCHVAQNIVTPDGEAEFIRHEFTSDISRGCPFCGSTNWRGDY